MVSLGRRLDAASTRIRSLVRAIQDNDEAKIEEAILRLSRRHRLLAPLALAVSAFVLLFDGLRLLVSNWRLTLVTGPAGDVDLAGDVRPQGARAARQVVPRDPRPDPDPDLPGRSSRSRWRASI